MKKTILIILFAVLFLPNFVNATPGYLRKDSIISCNGKMYGKHGDGHWHEASFDGDRYHALGEPLSGKPCGNTNTNSNNTNNNNTNNSPNNNNNTNTTIVKKSSVNTIKKLTINDDEIKIASDMNYSTLAETVTIKVSLNHSKASYKIEGNTELLAGENNFKIKVTAENGNVRTYNLIVTRILSSNTNIKVKINNEEINFLNNEYTIDVDSKTENIEYDYELEDTKSTVKIEEPKKLKSGKNTIKFVVTAEDGTEATYSIIVNKEKEEVEIIPEVEENDSKEKEETEEATLGDFIATFILLGTVGGAGGALAYFTNKPKK